jgi:hypothetical protein
VDVLHTRGDAAVLGSNVEVSDGGAAHTFMHVVQAHSGK